MSTENQTPPEPIQPLPADASAPHETELTEDQLDTVHGGAKPNPWIIINTP